MKILCKSYNLSILDIQVDETPAVDMVLKADKKRLALMAEVILLVTNKWPTIFCSSKQSFRSWLKIMKP